MSKDNKLPNDDQLAQHLDQQVPLKELDNLITLPTTQSKTLKQSKNKQVVMMNNSSYYRTMTITFLLLAFMLAILALVKGVI